MRPNKILVVDDSPLVRRMHAIFLKPYERKGVVVEYAENGREGLRKLVTSRDVDLVLLDLEMPEMTGFEFLEARRRDPSLADIPVLVVTTLGGPELVARVKKAGAFAIIRKPFDPESFYAAIQAALGQRPTVAVAG